MDERRFATIMQTWCDWCRTGRWVEGYPSRSPLFSTGDWTHFEDLCEASDTWLAEAVDAVINGIPADERGAVHHVWLHAVYEFLEPLEACYPRARESIMGGLRRKGIE